MKFDHFGWSGGHFSREESTIVHSVGIIFSHCLPFFPLVDQIEKIFTLAQKQRNWDHFTKAQRKNIELWLKQAKVGGQTEVTAWRSKKLFM